MYSRQKPGRFHDYPEHEPMLPLGWWHRLLWKAGFDPLSDHRRVVQLAAERDDWKRWLEESEADRHHLTGEIDRLAEFIMGQVPGEPSQSEGAVDTAIRLMQKGCHAR